MNRLDWIRTWAQGWSETLKHRPAEEYYPQLALEVATDMILELVEGQSKVDRLRAEILRVAELADDTSTEYFNGYLADELRKVVAA